MRKVIVLTTFLLVAPTIVFSTILFFLFRVYHEEQKTDVLGAASAVAYAALPENENLFNEEFVPVDARIELVRQFFQKYKSPLEPHAAIIVETADKYDLDFRLLPAIAMQESNLCKRIPKDSNNCWGFGIYGSKITRFADYPSAIEAVSKTLATKYKAKGLDEPHEIMKKYTPSSNGSWARGVNHFMEVLQ